MYNNVTKNSKYIGHFLNLLHNYSVLLMILILFIMVILDLHIYHNIILIIFILFTPCITSTKLCMKHASIIFYQFLNFKTLSNVYKTKKHYLLKSKKYLTVT